MTNAQRGANPDPGPASNHWTSGVDHLGLDGEPVDGATNAADGGRDVVVPRAAATGQPYPNDLPVYRPRRGRLIFLVTSALVVVVAAASFINLYVAINREPERATEGVAADVAQPFAAAPVAKDEDRIEPTPAADRIQAPPRAALPAPPERRQARAEPAVEPDAAEVVRAEDSFEEPPVEVEEPVAAASAADGVITRSVNLRAGPNNRARVLGVLQAGTPVAVLSCEHWCEVNAGGRRGFVYRSFLRR